MELEFDLIGWGPNINHRLSQEARHTMTNDSGKFNISFRYLLPRHFLICLFGTPYLWVEKPAKLTDLRCIKLSSHSLGNFVFEKSQGAVVIQANNNFESISKAFYMIKSSPISIAIVTIIVIIIIIVVVIIIITIMMR